jgi:putative nucleotidyltransferase with HDIG domain
VAIPDTDRARAILRELEIPRGIVVHSEGVSRVAVAAASMVEAASVPVDVPLVEVAALLHDIDKPEVSRTGGEHGIVGAQRLEQMGYDELAIPVASHPITALLDDARFPIGWASVLLAIADRHVAQRFMTVDERLDDMASRHPHHAAQIQAARRPAHALEAQLAEVLDLPVPELVARLRTAWETGAPPELELIEGGRRES